MARGVGKSLGVQDDRRPISTYFRGNDMKLDLLLDGGSEVPGHAPRLFATQLDPSKKLVELSDAELAKVGGGSPCSWTAYYCS